MPRTLDSATSTASKKEVITPVYLVELDFPSGFSRACSAPFSIFFDSNGDTVDEEFLGAGEIGGITAVEEGIDGKATRLTVTLSGVNPATLSLALGEKYQGRPARVWKGFLDGNNALDGPPHTVIKGIMSAMPIKWGPSATISVVIATRSARWERPLDAPIWDDADHQARRPGDTFFSRMAEITQGKEVTWGRG